MEKANSYIEESYLPAYNAELSHPAAMEGSAFVPMVGMNFNDFLCEQQERTVQADNCIQFEGIRLQIPKDKYRYHYVERLRCEFIDIPTGLLPSFMVRGSWRIMIARVSSRK